MSQKTYRVRNWKEYNQSLVQRGSLTLWVSEEIFQQWRCPLKADKRGCPKEYPLAINSQTQLIEACELTELGVQDCEDFCPLLDAIKGPIGVVIGDGAYDRFRCYEKIEQRQGVRIFPPQHNAVASLERTANKKKASPGAVAKRDEAIKKIRSLGRQDWKKQTRYHRRSLAETGMFRVKTVLGRRLSCHALDNQGIEAYDP